jgi:hypothetical protein
MTGQTVTVGNATIVLSSIDDPFSEGHTTGYLEFYDERHRPLFPLTSQAIQDHLIAILKASGTSVPRVCLPQRTSRRSTCGMRQTTSCNVGGGT